MVRPIADEDLDDRPGDRRGGHRRRMDEARRPASGPGPPRDRGRARRPGGGSRHRLRARGRGAAGTRRSGCAGRPAEGDRRREADGRGSDLAVVAPAARGRGLYRALIDDRVAWALGEGAGLAVALGWTPPDGCHIAAAMARAGFTAVAEIPGVYRSSSRVRRRGLPGVRPPSLGCGRPATARRSCSGGCSRRPDAVSGRGAKLPLEAQQADQRLRVAHLVDGGLQVDERPADHLDVLVHLGPATPGTGERSVARKQWMNSVRIAGAV